jgi:rhamnose utilization protein RhaD (predicted bifunctional aldolase and dehydrogenase)
MDDKLKSLIEMTLTLGQAHHNYVIIGEGNTSTPMNADAFYVKASGHQMAHISEAGFTAVYFDPILDLFDNPPETMREQKAKMADARVYPDKDALPSVEVGFHAMLLRECGAQYIGHTHPVAVNQLMCSIHAETFAQKRLFPDEVVLCGPESVFVPYIDPGLALAIVMREKVRAYMAQYDEAPKVILLKNHGVIAIGATPNEVLNITAMCVKAAQILMGTLAIGGAVFMDRADVMHIYKRPDEIYRRKLFVNQNQGETD